MKLIYNLTLGLTIVLLSACGAADQNANANATSTPAAPAAPAPQAASGNKTMVSHLAAIPSGKYGLDKKHGYITFRYLHKGLSNPRVGFNSFDTELDLNAKDPTKSSLKVTIDATSIDSRVAEFNDHLNGEKFFDTANFPIITFTSTSIKSTGANTYAVTGDLVMKGVTKPVTLNTVINNVAESSDGPKIGVSAATTIKRSNWDLGLYAPAIGDDVTLEIEVELPKT